MNAGFFVRIFSINCECWTKCMASLLTHRMKSIMKMKANTDNKIISIFFLMDLISSVEWWWFF